jgi:hypothetical protein
VSEPGMVAEARDAVGTISQLEHCPPRSLLGRMIGASPISSGRISDHRLKIRPLSWTSSAEVSPASRPMMPSLRHFELHPFADGTAAHMSAAGRYCCRIRRRSDAVVLSGNAGSELFRGETWRLGYRCMASRYRWRIGDQLGHPPEVLCDRRQRELVLSTAWAT